MVTYFRRLAPAILLIGTAAHAQGFEDLDALENRIVASLGAGVGEPGGPVRPIDRRLKLRPCPQPAEVQAPALGAVTMVCPPLGWRIRVPLVRSATPSFAQVAKAEPIIRKGDQVELTAGSSGFSVSTIAAAEQDGAPGDRIRVRSEGKKGAVIGVVTEDGRVSLPGFN